MIMYNIICPWISIINIPTVYLLFPKSYDIIQVKSEQKWSERATVTENNYERSYPK